MLKILATVLFSIMCASHVSAHTSAFEPRASEWECDLCSAIMDWVILNPNASTDIQKIIDTFCIIAPTECKKLVQDMTTVLKFVEISLSRSEQFTGFELCTMEDKCSVDCCLTPSDPEQVHISFIADPHNAMGVTWVTLTQVGTYVKYGTDPNKLTTIVSGSDKTYTQKGWIGWIHNVALINLKPGTKYYYSVGSDPSSVTGWSDVFSFTTESMTSKSTPLRILEIGDMGAGPNSNDTIKQIIKLVQSQQVDLVVHNGDISYADGYQGRWDQYFRKSEQAFANIPYMVTLGNHEIGIIGLLNLSIGYIHRFMLPGNNSLSTDYSNMYYSWNYGLVHFVSLDTENILDLPSITIEQVAWLEADLAAVDRTSTPWVIVYGHRPLYCSNPGDDCNEFAAYFRDNLEQIFNKYKVDLIFSAHKHNYERFWPIKPGGVPVKSLTNPGAPMYVLNGAGGNREGNSHEHTPQPYSVSFIPKWGYGIITIEDSNTLTWAYHDATDASVLDSFTLVVNH